ncbi:MAG: alkaline phosphatase family protein [Candidatus Aminicenantales bacterium]
MSIFKKKKKDRACVVGLDGVPCSMLLDLARTGVMPATAAIIDSGRLHPMRASLPEISSVSWANFMTGKNSGDHGIFGFTDFKPDSYEVRYPNFSDLRTGTFWDDLGRRDLKSIIINQPSTYPARKVNGVLVSGFVAVEPAKAVYPLTYKAALDQMGYRIDIDTLKARDDPEYLLDEIGRTLTARRKALDLLWKEDWNFFEFVITGTDRLHHFLWNAYEDDAHPHHRRFLDYYRQVDGTIGEIFASYKKMNGGAEGFYLLSDHGFTGIEQEVYLNAWLEREGYLKFAAPSPGGLQDIAAGTRAFALDPNRIYLNLRDRFPRGEVGASERDGLREEISRKIERLDFGGKRVVRRIFTAEEAYSGPLTSQGPDLIVVGADGFDMKASVKKKEVFGRSSLQGMHTWENALFWADTEQGPDLAIEDLAGIILKNFP